MWYLFACFLSSGVNTCTSPQQLPDRQACEAVGSALGKAIFGGSRRVICVNAQTGEQVNVKESG